MSISPKLNPYGINLMLRILSQFALVKVVHVILPRRFLSLKKTRGLYVFLMKLFEPFNQVQSNILMMEDLPNPSLVYWLLLQEEKKYNMGKLTGMHTDSVAFTVEKAHYDQGNGPTWNGNVQRGSTHNRNHQMSGTKRNNTYYCNHFHMKRHTIDRCYKLHGYPNKTRSNTKRFAATANTDSVGQREIESMISSINSVLFLVKRKLIKTTLPWMFLITPAQQMPQVLSILLFSLAKIRGSLIMELQTTCAILCICCANIRYMQGRCHEILIPNGNKVKVNQLGDIQLTPDLLLKNVLFVP